MTSPAARTLETSRFRVLATSALVSGSVVAAALAVGGLWLPWLGVTGVVVAVAAGLVAVWAAYQEFKDFRARAGQEATEALTAHGTQLHSERTRHREVMHVLQDRSDVLRGTVRAVTAENGELQHTVSTLRGDNAALRADLDTLQVAHVELRLENHELRTQVLADRATIADLRGEERPDADVFSIPRRRATGTEGTQWAAGEAPTVVELDLQRLASPFVEDMVRRHAN